MEACTFQPDLSLNSRINDCSVLSKYNGNFHIFDRLYSPTRREEYLAREQLIQSIKVEEEMSECTFKPSLNKTRVSGINEKIDAKDLVNDFEKSVGRLKTGFQKSMLLKAKLAYINTGEAYEEVKRKKENPPSFLNR